MRWFRSQELCAADLMTALLAWATADTILLCGLPADVGQGLLDHAQQLGFGGVGER